MHGKHLAKQLFLASYLQKQNLSMQNADFL